MPCLSSWWRGWLPSWGPFSPPEASGSPPTSRWARTECRWPGWACAGSTPSRVWRSPCRWGGPDEEQNNQVPNEAVRLTYEDGRTVKLGVARKDHARLANSINRHIDEYRAADRPAPRGTVVEALQCKEQTPERWLAALKRRPIDGYRTDLTRQQLLSVLQDPPSPPTARAAAAKLLRARVEDRPLIRVVAAQTAQPKMRIALETAASDEEEAEVDAALAEIAGS